VLFNRNADGIFSVNISAYGSSIAGKNYSLTCSATLWPDSNPALPDPSPMFEWFYGSDGSAPLPSGLTLETTFNGSTYTSKLEFSPLYQSHTGNYTCRLGAGNLTNSSMLTVTGKYCSIATWYILVCFVRLFPLYRSITEPFGYNNC
jgi:hypothetical protein